MRQTLGDTTPFTFLPHLYTSARREWLVVQLKLGLPCLHCLGKGRHARPDLSLWLLYGNAPRWLKGDLDYNISQTGRSMLSNTLLLLGLFGLGRRCEGGGGRHLTSALRWLLLCSLPCTKHKAINGHGLPSHHVSTPIRFGIKKVGNINGYLLGYLCGSLGFNGLFGLGEFLLDESLFINRRASKFSKMSGHTLYQFVPQRRELVRISISRTKFPSFSHRKSRRKKIFMPNGNIG